MNRRLPLLLILMLAAFAVPAWAHVPLDVTPEATGIDIPSTALWQAADAPAGIPWVAGLIALAVVIAGARRPRRALALAVVLILALFAYENGVHSVHHLNNNGAGASCTVASAAAHVAGTPVDAGTVEPIALPAPERVVLEQQPNFEVSSLAVHQGRAPPLAA